MIKHHAIPPALQAYIKYVWVLTTDDKGPAMHAFPFYADGCPGIIFSQAGNGMLLNNELQLSDIFLYGQTVKPVEINAAGSTLVVVGLYPHVLCSLFRFDAKAVTDNCLDFALLGTSSKTRVYDQLRDALLAEQQLGIIFSHLQQIIEKNNVTLDKGIQFAINRIEKTNGDISLKLLQTELNITERTFERRFEQHVGVSPKLFSKISQFQAALLQMKKGGFLRLSDIAYDNGYADQSHFIRSFKKFSGLAPLEFLKQEENS